MAGFGRFWSRGFRFVGCVCISTGPSRFQKEIIHSLGEDVVLRVEKFTTGRFCRDFARFTEI